MLEIVKKSLRLDENEFDEELNLLIGAAVEDLTSSGVASSHFYTKDKENLIINVKNKLLRLAIILYCKAMFGFDNPDSTKFYEAYEHIKKKVSINLKGD